MNIFEHAMQMEKDGEAYYRDLASRMEQEGVKRILLLLAEDEVGHYRAFSKLKEDSGPDLRATSILGVARNIFAELRGDAHLLKPNITELELYKKAIEVEKQSAAFYRQQAELVTTPYARETLLKIALDEDKHQFLLENMVTYLSRPTTWIENAEFNHLQEY